MEFSNKFKKIAPSPTLAIDAKFKQMKAEGMNVVGFGAGEPDFDTPSHIKQAAIDAIMSGKTKYTPASGTIQLKQAICEKFKNDNGLEYAPENIVVSNGAKHSLINAFGAILNPGDEVIIPAPYWVSYPEMVKYNDGVPVILYIEEKNEFKFSPEELEAAITPKTKALVLNTPCNPTGMVYEEDELRAIADIAVKHGIYVISDEIYAELNYGPTRHVSIAEIPGMKERTVIVSGFSKAYAMTGWRLGYACGEPEIISYLTKLHQYAIMCAPTMSQYAAVDALQNGDNDIEAMRKEYNYRRRFIVDGFNHLGLTCFEPLGAFYCFPSIKKTGMTSDEFCSKLLIEQKVAVVPGTAFGSCGEGFIRVSYAYSIEHIKLALKAIETFLKEHGL